MKKFMLIIVDEEGNEVAHFYDNINKAEDDRMCAVVSLGFTAQVYELVEQPEGFSCYEFLYE